MVLRLRLSQAFERHPRKPLIDQPPAVFGAQNFEYDQKCDCYEHHGQEREPVRLHRDGLDVLQLHREVAGGKAHGQEEDSGFGEEDGGASQFFDRLPFSEGNEIVVLANH